VHALPHGAKTGILRNINSPDILIQTNPGMVRTIAHFVMERFVNRDLIKSSHFPAKKMMVWYDSMPKNRVATKIFIN
jgi:L-serine deaminase